MAGRRAYEVVIVGAGIAGASLAYFLSEAGVSDVLLLEREEQLAVHSTGRSAATLVELDPHPTLLALKIQSASFLREPPPGFCAHPILKETGVLALHRDDSWEQARAHSSTLRDAGLEHELLDVQQVLARVPVLSPNAFSGGVFAPRDGRIDVHELLGSYLRQARARGVELRLGAEVREVCLEGGRVTGLRVADDEIECRLLVDAAGAWAGKIAALAQAAPIPLMPHRRTLFTFAPPDGIATETWPLVTSDADSIYFVPEAGEVMLSPMDEEAMDACDPSPDELVIARGLDRLRRLAPALVPHGIRRRWSGLRTFAPDRAHVVGADPTRPGFFWLAGQGGCGIETSPAVGRIAADLITTGETGRFDATLLAPERFARA